MCRGLVLFFSFVVAISNLLGQAPGTPDLSFGVFNGYTLVGYSDTEDSASSIIMVDGDKMIVSGKTNSDYSAIRVSPNGSKDLSFGNWGNTGFFRTTVGDGGAGSRDSAILPDNKILLVGPSAYSGDWDLTLVRLTPDGDLDTSFGNNGVSSVDLGGTDWLYSMELKSDGKIVASGRTNLNGSASELLVVQFNSDGSLDTGFGNGGYVIPDLGVTGLQFSSAFEVKITDDGKIVAGGNVDADGIYGFAIVQLLENGQTDPSFGNNGVLLEDISPSTLGSLTSVAIQQDGRILMGGWYRDGSDRKMIIKRYLENGSNDNSFGSNGQAEFNFGNIEYLNDVLPQPDGKILGLGGVDNDLILFRINSDGSIDGGFGDNGSTITHVVESFTSGEEMVLQNDGKVVIVGYSFTPPSQQYFVGRYNTGLLSNNDFKDNSLSVIVEPNPARHNTTLRYKLLEDTSISVHLYDIMGRLIRTIISEEYAGPGEHKFDIDVSNLPSGIYFLDLRNGVSTATTKLIKE